MWNVGRLVLLELKENELVCVDLSGDLSFFKLPVYLDAAGGI